jgi:ribosome-interacting GTPase 1
LYALNKIDDITMEELEILDKISHYVPVSAHLEWNLDDLVEKCWEYLDLIRFPFMKLKITYLEFTLNRKASFPITRNQLSFPKRLHQ